MEFGPVIKNPVLDINKLVLQGTMLNQSVQTVEGDSTADQATTDLLAKKDPVIQEISVGMSGEEASLYTVSGTPPLSLPNSLGKPLTAWSVDVLPYQEGTGDPSPSNVRPIHGTDKLTITTAGKNLFDPVNYSAYLQSDGTYLAKAALFASILNAIPSECIGKRCVFSAWIDLRDSGNLTWAQVRANVNGVAVGGTIIQNGTSRISVVAFTPTSANDTIALTYGSNGGNNMVVSSLQLEFGSTATPYTPYLAPSQTVLTLPSTVYTATIGSDGGESRWGEVDLGTLSWMFFNIEGHYRFVAYPQGIKSFDSNLPANILCSSYAVDTANHVYNDVTDKRIASGGGVLLVYDSDYSSADDFKTAMSGVQLVYELATPTTFAVPSVTIPTPKGTATTWATAEDGSVDSMVVTYVGKA